MLRTAFKFASESVSIDLKSLREIQQMKYDEGKTPNPPTVTDAQNVLTRYLILAELIDSSAGKSVYYPMKLELFDPDAERMIKTCERMKAEIQMVQS